MRADQEGRRRVGFIAGSIHAVVNISGNNSDDMDVVKGTAPIHFFVHC